MTDIQALLERLEDVSGDGAIYMAPPVRMLLDEAAACIRSMVEWRPIEDAPHEELVILGWWEGDIWKQEIGLASAGQRFANGYSNRWQHGQATHCRFLPPPPIEGGKS